MTTFKKPGSLQKYPALASVLANAGLKFVDIGGRGEAFAGLVTLADFAHYYVSEPDAAEAARLREQLPIDARWRGVTVIADAIGSRPGTSTLRVTRAPGMSSLLEPDPAVAGGFYLSAAFDVIGEEAVSTVGLDAAAAAHGFEDASFLKLDTQGTELDILQSGPRLLRDSLIGVHTESLFRPFYRGQSLFADVDSHLRANGFSLISLSRTSLRRRGFDETLYSKRVITWAHCLYFREPDQILAAGRPDAGRDLLRLLAFAVAFEHFDLAIEVTSRIGPLRLLPPRDHEQLVADVRHMAVGATRYAQRKAEQGGFTEELLAGASRDRRRFE